MASVVESIRAEFLRYRALAEAAIAQVDEAQLSRDDGRGGNSIATICWHVAGNFQSRFTDFLTDDGEKPWRHRDEEFEPREVARDELMAKWSQGWDVVLATLDQLSDGDLGRTVRIRRQELAVLEALHRSLAHLSYHVGQIVFVAKSLRGQDWNSLSIPLGQSENYNRSPSRDRTPLA